MRHRLLAFTTVFTILAPLGARAEIVPEAVPDLPVLGGQAYRGNDLVTAPTDPVTPTPKTVDGDIDDWTGDISRFGGTAIYSRGEYVYQDYVMDDWGADDGIDADRTAVTDQLIALEPRTYRGEILPQAAGEQFGAPPPIGVPVQYGDAQVPDGFQDQADIEEVRIAADEETLSFLVRTTGMTDPDATAVLVLLDVEEGGSWQVPGGITTAAEVAFVAIGDGIPQAWLRGEPLDSFPEFRPGYTVATNEAGYVNAMEITVSRDVLPVLPAHVKVGVATGVSEDGVTLANVKPGGAASDLINVAFRFDEPARVWMDHDQALALRAGDIDRFLADVDLGKLQSGYTETFEPRPGYFERVYQTDSAVNQERSGNSYWQGSFQHYGIYFPSTWRPGRATPATWWTHYRGGHAHDAAAWIPGLLRQLGEDRGNIIITPGARGTSSWYVGRGHEDFLDVWDDSMASFSIDPDRVYMSGYSMGGYASWLLPLLYPDRFAASFPTAGPPTQGLWLGAGPPQSPQNGGDIEAQQTFDIIGNAANVGYVIYQGSNDELVPVSGVARMAAELALRGYDHRFYVFPGAEHYTNAIYDEWTEAARYFDRFTRDPNPPRVVYTVKPALERAVELVSAPEGAGLDYTFDGAYWVDGLKVRTGDLTHPTTLGTIDARTWGRGFYEEVGIPEASSGGQIAPHVMTGLRNERIGFVEPANRFEVTLTNVATATLDVSRMSLSTSEPISATITTDGPTTITLLWRDGSERVLTFEDAGTHVGTILP